MRLRVLLALLWVYDRDGRATTRTVALRAGCCAHTAHRHLRGLVADGLVSWDHPGSLRPLVHSVPFGEDN